MWPKRIIKKLVAVEGYVPGIYEAGTAILLLHVRTLDTEKSHLPKVTQLERGQSWHSTWAVWQ